MSVKLNIPKKPYVVRRSGRGYRVAGPRGAKGGFTWIFSLEMAQRIAGCLNKAYADGVQQTVNEVGRYLPWDLKRFAGGESK